MRTDPTYKEWKPGSFSVGFVQIYRTDPTYKEWKLDDLASFGIKLDTTHGSYLQGMETGKDHG